MRGKKEIKGGRVKEIVSEGSREKRGRKQDLIHRLSTERGG